MEGGALRPVLPGPGAPDTMSELISQMVYNIRPWKSASALRRSQEARGLTFKLHSQEVRQDSQLRLGGCALTFQPPEHT